jgi:hypothetical protein
MPDDRIADRTAGTADHLNPSRFPGAGAAKDRFLEAQAAGWAIFNQKLEHLTLQFQPMRRPML